MNYKVLMCLMLLLVCCVGMAGATTVILYPDTSDGWVTNASSAAYATLRNAPGSSNGMTDTAFGVPYLEGSTAANLEKNLRRGIFPINTGNKTLLPTGAIIDSAVFSVQSSSIIQNLSGTYNVTLTGGHLISNTTLSDGDYQNFTSTELAPRIESGSWVLSASTSGGNRNNFVLNPDGINYIDLNGYTVFYMRDGWDTLGGFDGTWGSGKQSYTNIYLTNDANIGRHPNLTINYHLSTAPTVLLGISAENKSHSTINWTWTNSPDLVMIYKNGVFHHNLTGPAVNDRWTGLLAGTSYTISTKSCDLFDHCNSTWVNATSSTVSPSINMYYIYGDSVARAYPYGGDLPVDGSGVFTHQYVTNYDPTGLWDHNMDGAGKESSWGIANFATHYNYEDYWMFDFGINDLKNGVDANITAANYETLYNLALTNGSTPIPVIQTTINTSYDTTTYPYRTLANQSAFISIIESYLTSKDIPFMRGYDAVDSGYNNHIVDATNDNYLSDSVHPNLTGHSRLASIMAIYINPIVASFTPSGPVNTWYPTSTQFTDTSMGSPTSWVWNATNVTGNNIPFTFNTTQNATLFPKKAGNYTISLNASNSYTYNLSAQLTWVNVSAITANFAPNVTIGYQYPMPVTFTDLTTDTPVKWEWSFGDNYTSTLQNPTHIYTVANNYTVWMNVTDSVGITSNVSKTVQLLADDDIWLKSWLHYNTSATLDEKGVAWTNSGTSISTTIKKFGNGSLFVPTGNNYISSASSSVWDRSAIAGEVENWIYVSSYGDAGKPFFRRSSGTSGTTNGWGFFNINGTRYGNAYYYGSGANYTTPFDIPLNTWVHTALVRDTNQYWNVYVNGIKWGPSVYMDGLNVDTANPFMIGSSGPGTEPSFYVDEFRFTQGVPRFVSDFSTPYAQYNGALQPMVDTSPNSTYRYKTDPTGYAPIANQTNGGLRNRTVQVQNISQATYLIGGGNFDPMRESVRNVYPNKTVYSDLILENYTIDNTLGIISYNVSRGGTNYISSLFDNRTSFLDVEVNYWNYTVMPSTAFEYFAYGYLRNGTSVYPIHNFVATPIAFVDWIIRPEFSANATLVNIGQPIKFSDIGQGEPTGFTNYAWNFGDGGTSTLQNPIYSYSALGNYTVSLTTSLAANTSVTNSTTKTSYISVTSTVLTPPVANFVGVPTSAVPGSTITFTDTSTNVPTSWIWTFGDGSGSTLQNPTHIYSAIGNYTVNLTATNAFGSNTTSKVNYTWIKTSVSGFNQQDLTMSPQFTLTVNFVDSSTNLPIPVVFVTDNLGNNQTTTTGTFVGTYPYSTVVLYLTSSGYDGKAASYIVDEDRVETVQMVKSVSTNQNANVIWQPRSVAIQILDANYNPIIGVPVYITAHNSSLPGGLSGAVEYFKNTYGVTDSTAQSMFNSSVTYSANTDDYGFISTQVIDVIQYKVVTTDTSGATVTRLFWPAGPYYQIVTGTALVSGIAAQGRAQTSINTNSTFNTTFWQPNTTYSCMGVNVYDSTGQTNFVHAWWKLVDNGTVWNQNTTPLVGGKGPVNSTKCVLHVPYQQWKWGGITG